MSKEKERVEKTIEKTNDLETLTQLKLGMKSKTKQFLLHLWHPSWLPLFMLLVVYIVLVLKTTFYLFKKTYVTIIYGNMIHIYLFNYRGWNENTKSIFSTNNNTNTHTREVTCFLPPFINLGFLSFQTVVFFLLEKMSILCFNVIVITFWSYLTE